MTQFTRSASVAAIFTVLAGAAHAELTADQLWASWQETASAAGLGLSAEAEVREGASLRLSGVTLSLGNADDPATTAEAILDEILLTEEEDGSVTVVPSAELSMAKAAAEGGFDSGEVTVSHSGLEISVSEGEGALSYDIEAESLVLEAAMTALSPASSDPAAPQLSTNSFEIGFEALTAVVDDIAGDNRSIEISLMADELAFDTVSADPAMDVNSVQTSATADIEMDATITLPKTLALAALTTPEAWATAFGEGMGLEIAAVQGESGGSMKDENAFAPMTIQYSGKPGETNLSIDAEGFALETLGAGASIGVTSAMLPIPKLDIEIGPMVIDTWMPLMAAATAGEFGLTFKLADVTVNEEAWAVIDPAKSLPRDPIQLAIDASGTAKLDLFGMMAAETGGMTAVTPPQPETLTITEMTLKLAGAALAGTGAFTFDNASGMPVPAGEANVSLKGGNALIDKLIALGLVTEQDAGGARMMMAMFMAPASGPDDLTSKIEAKADGSILVNGQQIQ